MVVPTKALHVKSSGAQAGRNVGVAAASAHVIWQPARKVTLDQMLFSRTAHGAGGIASFDRRKPVGWKWLGPRGAAVVCAGKCQLPVQHTAMRSHSYGVLIARTAAHRGGEEAQG